jgi:membrane-anchored mycosin MYCP
VGGVGADNQFVEEYQPNTVEVVAPGADVTGIGPGGVGALSYTGTRFAVAFAAGQAALVRAAYPELTATQVKQRIRATTDALEAQTPDASYGSGMINPAASVARTVDGEQPAPAVQNGGGGGGGMAGAFFIGVALILGGIVTVLALRLRRRGLG